MKTRLEHKSVKSINYMNAIYDAYQQYHASSYQSVLICIFENKYSVPYLFYIDTDCYQVRCLERRSSHLSIEQHHFCYIVN